MHTVVFIHILNTKHENNCLVKLINDSFRIKQELTQRVGKWQEWIRQCLSLSLRNTYTCRIILQHRVCQKRLLRRIYLNLFVLYFGKGMKKSTVGSNWEWIFANISNEKCKFILIMLSLELVFLFKAKLAIRVFFKVLKDHFTLPKFGKKKFWDF